MHQVEQYKSVNIFSAQHSVCMCVSKTLTTTITICIKSMQQCVVITYKSQAQGGHFVIFVYFLCIQKKIQKNAPIFTRISTKTMI